MDILDREKVNALTTDPARELSVRAYKSVQTGVDMAGQIGQPRGKDPQARYTGDRFRLWLPFAVSDFETMYREGNDPTHQAVDSVAMS